MKVDSIFRVAALLLCLSPLTAQAGSPIDSLSVRIAGSSASLRTLTLQETAAVENMRADNRLPDPTLEFESLWTSGASKITGSVSQEFEFPTAYSARGRAADSKLNSIDLARKSELLDLALDAKLLIIDYVYQQRRLGVLRQMKENLDSVAAKVETGLRGGEMTKLDLRKIRVRQTDLARTMAETEMMAAETVGKINAIADGLGRPADFSSELARIADYPDSRLMPAEYYEELALRSNPALWLNAANSATARDLERAAKAERLPSFGVGYVFNREEGRNYNGFRVSASLPIWQGSARSKAAQLEVKSAELAEESALMAETARVRALHGAALAGEKALAEKSESLGNISGPDSWLALLKRALDAGSISMLDYLNEASFFLDASLELEDVRHAQAQLKAQLDKFSMF